MNGSLREYAVQKISCMKKPWHENFMHKNFIFTHGYIYHIFMHENDFSTHENENFAPCIIFSHQIISWVVGLYITSCMEFSPVKTLGQNLHFHALPGKK